MTSEDTNNDLSEKQIVELEESIAAQARIVEELKEQDHAAAKRFLEVLLKCKDDLRRPKAKSFGGDRVP